MNLPVAALLVAFAALTLWGVVSPRGQWRVLAGWTRRHSYADEPSLVSVSIHRLVAIVATVALGLACFTLYQQYQTTLPKPPTAISALQQMWGAPNPVVLNRVISNASAAPDGLVPVAVAQYESMDGSHRSPPYLFDLQEWSRPSQKAWAGTVGSAPSVGLTALDNANLVVQVRGDSRCIPRAVTVAESSTNVVVGVYYGRPDGSTAAPGDCRPVSTDADSVSVLIPITLLTNLGKRTVSGLDGKPVPAVKDLVD